MSPDEKSDRLIEATCCILDAAPHRRLNIVVLNKVLFYVDLASLRDAGQVLTHNAYIALKQGPVVAKYPKRIVDELQSRGFGQQASAWDGSKPVRLENAPVEFQFIDEEKAELIEAVTEFFAEATSRQVSDYSHENPGWKLAWDEFRQSGKPGCCEHADRLAANRRKRSMDGRTVAQ